MGDIIPFRKQPSPDEKVTISLGEKPAEEGTAKQLTEKQDESDGPQLQGEVVCIGCKHKWMGVASVGTQWLECPECGTMKGTWRAAVEAGEGDTVYKCSYCGGVAMTAFYRANLFWFICMNCGVDHTESIFGTCP